MASERWPESAGRLIDRAVTQLDQEGIVILDEDARRLLDSGGAIRQQSDQRVHLRSGFVRRSLQALPAGFNLYDRAGRRAHTVAGGRKFGRFVTLHATLTCARSIKADQHDKPGEPPAGIRLPADREHGLGAFDLVGCAPPLEDATATHGDLHRLFTNLIAAPHPQLMRPRSAEVVTRVHAFLTALRGSPTSAEAKPYVICEAVADAPGCWDTEACRVLCVAARHGIPIAPVAAPPVAPDSLDRWVIEAAAALIAAVALHRCWRREAPILWGVPLLQLHCARPEALVAMRLLLGAGRELGLPTLATVVPWTTPPATAMVGDMAPLWALQATARGADIVAWGGWCDDGRTLDLGQLARHARQVAELRRVLAEAPSGAAPARDEPGEVSPELLQSLATVVRDGGPEIQT
jgi:trimethylamine:corrinoid methyltransferase-like protein